MSGSGLEKSGKKSLVKGRYCLYKPAQFPKLHMQGGPVSPAPRVPNVELEYVMAVPKRKTTPSKRGMRRAADALKAPTYVEDKNSGELRRPHHIDLKTGMYRGRQVLTPKENA